MENKKRENNSVRVRPYLIRHLMYLLWATKVGKVSELVSEFISLRTSRPPSEPSRTGLMQLNNVSGQVEQTV